MVKCLYVQIKYWCYVTSVISHSRDIATATNATLYSSCFPSSSHCFIFHKVCCFLKTEKHCKREWNATLKKKKGKCKHIGLPGNSDLGILSCHSQPEHLEVLKPRHWHTTEFPFWKLRRFLRLPKTTKALVILPGWKLGELRGWVL